MRRGTTSPVVIFPQGNMPLSLSQQRALSIIPHFSGFLSMFGSGSVVKEVICNKKRREKTYHRLVLGLCCCDFVASGFCALSTWPIPKETSVYAASGNDLTCTMQGMGIQFAGIAGPFYNFSLAMYYLLVTVRGWNEEDIKKVERFMHIGPLSFGILTTMICLLSKSFNNANLWCWIAPARICEEEDDQGGTRCYTRGKHSVALRWALFYGPLWFALGFLILSLFVICLSVREIERNMEQKKLTRWVALQAACYLCVFSATWASALAGRILQSVNGTMNFPLFVLMTIMVPGTGFGNYFVYKLPRFRDQRDNSASFCLRSMMCLCSPDNSDSGVTSDLDPSVLIASAEYTRSRGEFVGSIEVMDTVFESQAEAESKEEAGTSTENWNEHCG